NAYPININSIGTYAGSTSAQTAQFWTKPVTGFGQATNAAVNVTNGWTLQSSQPISTTANTTGTVGASAPLILTGMAVSIPANSYYLFCVSLSSIRYSTLGTQTGTFTSGGCIIDCTAGNGFGGTLTSPSNTPRGFIGVINFSPGYIPTPLDLGVSAFLKPLGSKICYATDTIVVTLKNFGTATVDFSVNTATVTATGTGPTQGSYSLAVTSGTLASNATQDFTLSTNYSVANMGTYKLKGYATVTGDGSALNDTTSTSISRSPLFTTSVLPNDSVCLGASVQLNANYSPLKQVGTGSIVNSATSYPSPYGNFYKGARHQFLVLASELTAAGLIAGNVNSISFNVTNLNTSGAFINHNIAIATTTLTNITAFQTTGFTTYFSSPSYTPTLGSNTHVFSTPYVWDGVSNIIIETCFNNNPLAYTQNVSVTQSSTPFTSSVWFNSDVDATLCSASNSTGSMSQRPNMGFGQPTTVTYSWSPANGLSATNIFNPVANVSASTTFTVEGTIGTCMTYDTVRIYIKPTPTPNLGPDSLYCSLPVILNANTSANSYLWNNGSIGSSLNVTTPGKYWIRATNSNGCANSDTLLVTLGSLPIFTLGSDTAFCQGSTINLYAGTGAGNIYQWSNGATTSSIVVGATGTYSVLVTNTIGCQSSDAINVSSKPKPSVSLIFVGAQTFCESDNANRLLTEGTPANGTYIGAGVTTTTAGSYFNSTTATQGSHIILYNYTGPNGCSNTAKDTLVVNACVGVEELSSNFGLNVYPNPTSGIFTIELNTSEEINAHVSIMTIDSKLVYDGYITGNGMLTKTINLDELADGIYYLKLDTKDSLKTYKILKQ
ncbi:MAG: T9SS type A sorting domain-containing protein, partial [Chitinophagaceae bacterium]